MMGLAHKVKIRKAAALRGVSSEEKLSKVAATGSVSLRGAFGIGWHIGHSQDGNFAALVGLGGVTKFLTLKLT